MVILIHTLKCQTCTALLSCGDHWPMRGGGRKQVGEFRWRKETLWPRSYESDERQYLFTVMKYSDVLSLRIFTAAPLDYSLAFISPSARHSVVLHLKNDALRTQVSPRLLSRMDVFRK